MYKANKTFCWQLEDIYIHLHPWVQHVTGVLLNELRIICWGTKVPVLTSVVGNNTRVIKAKGS